MKKTIAMFFAILMALSLAACADPQISNSSQASGTDNSPEATPGINEGTDQATEAVTKPAVNPIFDMDKAIAYIDSMTIGDYYISLTDELVDFQGHTDSHITKIVKAGDKFTANEGTQGDGVWLDEGYYHYYTLRSSKWTYYATYEMLLPKRYDAVVNSKYWWKSELTLLGFTDYAKLKYKTEEKAADVSCAVYECVEEIGEYGPVTVTLWVDLETGNVLQLRYSFDNRPALADYTHIKTITLNNFKTEDISEIKFKEPAWEIVSDESDFILTKPIFK